MRGPEMRWVMRALAIRPEEWDRTAGMFLYLMAAVGAFITGRITRDTLFLSRYDVSYLPYMYVWVALVMSALSYAYYRFADAFRRDRLILAVTSALLVGVLLARVMLSVAGAWFYPVLYVFIEAMGALLMIQFWTFANDVFTTRQAKRLFGIVGAGGVMATVVAGFAISTLARQVGTANLLFLVAGLLAACLVLVSWLSTRCWRELAQSLAGAPPRIKGKGMSLGSDLGKVFASRHLKVIAWLTILTFIVVTLVDYQFKIIARYSFLNREDQLSGFFGMFYGIAGVLSFFIQIGLTGRLLQRYGIIVGLMLVPMFLLGGSVLLIILPGLAAATVLKGADNVLRYTINDATTQVLYLPVQGRIRGRAKAVIEGVLKPVAQGLTGLAIAWTASMVGHRVHWLGFGSLAFLLAWVVLILGMKSGYIQTLISTLRKRNIHFGDAGMSVSGPQTVAALEQTLGDSEEHNVLHAMEMIPFVQQHDWSGQLERLLDHNSAQVRVQAIRLLAREGPSAAIVRVLAMFHDEDDSVRAEAVNLYCATLKEKAMQVVEPQLGDASVRVKASAVAGLIQYGGLDGIILAADTLKDMLAHPEHNHRRAGAWVIGRVHVRTFYRSLLPLLEDDHPSVRVEAVRSAGALGSPELILSLIQRLRDPKTRRAAVAALSTHGEKLLTTMRTILFNEREDLNIRLAIPRVLADIGEQLSMDILSSVIETHITPLRTRGLEAIVLLHSRYPELVRDKEMLRRVLHRELKQAYQFLATLNDIRTLSSTLLNEALECRLTSTIERIFKLLRVLFSGRHMDVVHRNLANSVPSIRANALELLENSVDEETRRCLLPLLEIRDRKQLARMGDELFPLMHRDGEGWLFELLVDEHSWTVACALSAIRELKIKPAAAHVQLLLKHEDPLVRESAAFAIEALETREEVELALSGLKTDPSPLVSRAAQHLCAMPST